MNIREISKPVTAKSLNESLAKKFGTKINIETFTLEQLQDARNRIRTKLSQVETNESFDTVHKDEGYIKSKLFLDVLNAAISERADIAEGEIPPQFKKNVEKMKSKAKGKKEETKESVIREGEEDKAELVMAAKDMVDRLTGWMEDTAEMQTESMLELADAIRDEMGSEASEAFTNSVKPALEQLYTAMETTRVALTSGVGQLTGEAAPETLGAEDEVPAEDPAMEPTVDAEMGDEALPAEDDGMAAAAPAAGGEEEAGRAKRESVERSRKLGTLLSSKKK
jgi:hypothetical protein